VSPRFGGLWGHRDFARLWAAQTIPQFGTGVTHLALPLTAAVTLSDRLSRRPILVAADVGFAPLSPVRTLRRQSVAHGSAS
jgi:hypothetical protein